MGWKVTVCAFVVAICGLNASAQVINDPANVTASIGDTVNLEWTYNAQGQLRLFEVWKKAPSMALASRSGGPVQYFRQNQNGGDPKYSVIGLATLQVKDVQKEDNGPYELSITFGNGYVLSSTAYLIVNYPPSIDGITASPSSTVREGSSLTLMCNADGNPEPAVRWTRQSGALGKAATIDANSGNLVFPNITLADKGTYTCSVDNGIPEAASKDISINVLKSTATALYPAPRSGVGRLQACMYVMCLLLSIFLAGPRQS
ncbi:peroxidasin homolog isoform X3 [Branchiostoma floridae]|uniref:Peroxidasin homolog isoform X3 n=1 Tax=Branchiostoma floridae TaxID=7739 RepID=A0A9J7HDS6_BRAFL|nr:peroxidasin homolog isoform X3 [Branchiostoma floridae]